MTLGLVGMINPAWSQQRDYYHEYIRNIQIAHSFLSQAAAAENIPHCEEEDIRQKHRRSLQRLEQENDEHTIDTLLQELASLDIHLARCKYRNNKEQYTLLLKEAAAHQEGGGQYQAAGQLYYDGGDIVKARECFKREVRTIEALMRITPLQELPKIRDEFVRQKDYWRAGKIDWFLGDRKNGKVLMQRSTEYHAARKEAEGLVGEQRFASALHFLWRKKVLPFYEETMRELCGSDRRCRQEVEKYDPQKNRPMLF